MLLKKKKKRNEMKNELRKKVKWIEKGKQKKSKFIRLLNSVGPWATWWLRGLKAKRIRNENDKEEGKEEKEVKWQRLSGAWESNNAVYLWLIVSTAKRAYFHMKFWEKVLLDARNIPTVADFVFNNSIVRFVVGKLNPKTFI